MLKTTPDKKAYLKASFRFVFLTIWSNRVNAIGARKPNGKGGKLRKKRTPERRANPFLFFIRFLCILFRNACVLALQTKQDRYFPLDPLLVEVGQQGRDGTAVKGLEFFRQFPG